MLRIRIFFFGCMLALMNLILTGCGPEFETLEMTPLEDPPEMVSLDGDGLIVIPAGDAVIVAVRPISSSNTSYDGYDVIRLRSRNNAIFDVLESAADRVFVFRGIAVGSTCMEVHINSDEETCIAVEITPQNKSQL